MKMCPFCQKEVEDNAFKCKFCGGWFSNDAESNQKTLDSEESAKKILREKKDKVGEPLGERTECFSVSTQKMVVMSLLTFGVYDVYWFYRNWRAIKVQEDKKISPFWRAVFCVIFCYTLFKRIINSAVEKGYKGVHSPGELALLYIAFVIVASRAPSPYDMIGIFSFIPIIYMNNAIRFRNVAIDLQHQERQPLTRGEILFVILGLVLWGLNILGILYPEAAA
ncbi:MAG: hypothetical protein KAR32_06945 [Candidatus Omnitrophica bacterium]|nr:hypothetical protein [Candidatus Omnitrophota bacterium]